MTSGNPEPLRMCRAPITDRRKLPVAAVRYGNELVPVRVHRLGEREDEAADDGDSGPDPEDEPVRAGEERDAADDETDDDRDGPGPRDAPARVVRELLDAGHSHRSRGPRACYGTRAVHGVCCLLGHELLLQPKAAYAEVDTKIPQQALGLGSRPPSRLRWQLEPGC